jgi:hypothetical protein
MSDKVGPYGSVVWKGSVPMFRRRLSGENPTRSAGPVFEPFTPLKEMPAASTPVELLDVTTYEQVPGFVYLLWDAEPGILAVAYPTLDEAGAASSLWVREFQPGIRCLIEVASQGFHAPDGPDVYDQALESGERALLWRYYARAIGQAAPYWPWNLNYRDLIQQWRPGHATVTAVPQQSPDMTPLLHMAALYEQGSSTHRVLMHYYYKGVRDASGGSRMASEAFAEEFFHGLADKLVLGARAVDAQDPEDLDDLDEHALRAVFSGLLERQDTLAVEVIRALRHWGATKHMPFATYDRYRVGNVVMLSEWLRQLDEVPSYLPDPRFAGLTASSDRVGRLFIDRVTGAPAAEITNWRGEVTEYVTLVPRRLPATTPLAELIIDGGGHSNWVRTEDGTLYPVPGGDYDVAWGYSGSGYGPLVERLLDDINTAPLDEWHTPAENGLTTLTRRATANGTVFTRAQLEATRRRPR